MTAQVAAMAAARRTTVRNHAVPLLQVFALTLMVFPAYSILKPVGAGGYVAALVAYVAFLAWLSATLFGQHNPLEYRTPVRIALAVMWMVSLASYALMNRANLSSTEQLGADRWLLQLADASGIILVASEFLRSLEDVRRVLRVLTFGGAFCGAVAAIQFWLGHNIAPYLLRVLPGFSIDQAVAANATTTIRGGLNRVVGTATDPIELGVVAGMLLPLAIYLAIYDTGRSRAKRWLPVMFILIAVPTSVSRSAILAAGLGVSILVVSLPPLIRVGMFSAIAVAVAGVFVTAHGLIGTLKSYFFAGTSDPSIAHRVNNYPYVEELVRRSPWFGQGGGTYLPVSGLNILDNQYLTTVIELGLVGMAALAFFLLWPALTALTARQRTNDQELKDLCAALAGAALAATVCSATFDSLSFPMFANVQALVLGLIGATWLIIERANKGTNVSRPIRHYTKVSLTGTARRLKTLAVNGDD